jgi:ATP-dependent DNA helicase PIF1
MYKIETECLQQLYINDSKMNEELSLEQNYAFEKFKGGQNLFITGPGGTGKTRLIKHLVEHTKKHTKKKIQVCALTGCAAVLLNCGARTIHSWSGIRIAKGPSEKVVDSVVKNKKAIRTWKSTDILIVDEISMMSKKIVEILDKIGKLARCNSLPFGGMQIIFTGDFFQLPPVGSEGEPDTEIFCFESPVWNQLFKMENHVQLTSIFRQNDPTYIQILSEIRNGELSKESIEVLKQNVKREYDATKHGGFIPTKLFPIRSKVDFVNTSMFSKIDETEYEFEHTSITDCKTNMDSGKTLPFEILVKESKISEQEKEYEIENILNNTPCSRILRLKKGSTVMCTVNIDMDNKICNGSQGVVTDIIDTEKITNVVVKFSNDVIKTIQPHCWQSEEHPSIVVKQYPLCLAWALTIHKIQGATLSMGEIDIGTSIFEYGQTYVALSRIKSLDGLYISAFNPERIQAHPKVKLFYTTLPKIDIESLKKKEIDFKAYELKEEPYQDPNVKVIKF